MGRYACMTVCSYTHLYVLTHVHAFTSMSMCSYNMPTGTDTRLCTFKIHAHLHMWCTYAHTHLYALTQVPTLTCVCAHTRVHVRTGGLILQTNLHRGSVFPWLELPKMLWNWRRQFLLPPHPRGDHPLSRQPTLVFLSALVFPLPQVTSELCPRVGQRLHTHPKICWGRRGLELERSGRRSHDSLLPSSGQRKKSPTHREGSPLGKNWAFGFPLVYSWTRPGLPPMPIPARIRISSSVPLGPGPSLMPFQKGLGLPLLPPFQAQGCVALGCGGCWPLVLA